MDEPWGLTVSCEFVVLNQCSKGKFREDPTDYRIEYFLKYMIKILKGAMGDIDFYYERARKFKKLPESAVKILDCFKEKAEEKLKTKELSLYTSQPVRTVTNALRILVDGHFLSRHGQGAATYYQLIF